MDILTKFEAVTVKAEIRLAETDRLFCEAHEKAYRTALACFQEMEYIWAVSYTHLTLPTKLEV